MKKYFIIFYLIILTFTTSCSNKQIKSTENNLKDEENDILEIKNSSNDIEKNKLNLENIINNGNMVVQYGDLIYFYAPNDNNDSKFDWAIYSMKEDGTQKNKIIETDKNKLYFIDNYIITQNYYETYNVLKISIETGKSEVIANGLLNYVDTIEKEIYYSANNYYSDDEGIFKIDIDGGNKVKLCSSEYNFAGKEGDIIYLKNSELESNAILSSIQSNGLNFKEIATISPNFEGYTEENTGITKFDICGDWIILSAGSYQGSANIFYGGLMKMKKDGSESQYFYDGDIDEFEIIDNWIYFNVWAEKNNENADWEGNGCYRIHPDLSERKYFGKEIDYLMCSKNNYLYYTYSQSDESSEIIINDLRQCDKEGNNIITLFYGDNADLFEDSYYVGYSEIENVGKYVYFGVDVHGYTTNDTWRGHTCSYKYYRCLKDGSNLEMLYENKNLKCPNI